jgi:hypothetical protein
VSRLVHRGDIGLNFREADHEIKTRPVEVVLGLEASILVSFAQLSPF